MAKRMLIWTGLMVLAGIAVLASVADEDPTAQFVVVMPMLMWIIGVAVIGLVPIVESSYQRAGPVAAGPADPSSAAAPDETPGTVTSSYRARSEAAARAFAAAEAARMEAEGYEVVGATWTPGAWPVGAWVGGAILSLWLIGIPILIYLVVVKPMGTLTVSRRLRGPEDP